MKSGQTEMLGNHILFFSLILDFEFKDLDLRENFLARPHGPIIWPAIDLLECYILFDVFGVPKKFKHNRKRGE